MAHGEHRSATTHLDGHPRLVQVRRAQRQDAPAIEALYRLLVPGDDNIAVTPERLATLEGDATNHLLVADIDGAVSATGFLTICLDAMYGFQPYGVVENVIVDPAVRGQRVGAALMKEIEQIARAARCTKLMLLSSHARTDAHTFFQRLGFDGESKRGFVKYLNRVPAPGAGR